MKYNAPYVMLCLQPAFNYSRNK